MSCANLELMKIMITAAAGLLGALVGAGASIIAAKMSSAQSEKECKANERAKRESNSREVFNGIII